MISRAPARRAAVGRPASRCAAVRRAEAIVVVVLCGLLVVACSTTIAGRGRPATGGVVAFPTAPGIPGPTISAGPPSTGSPGATGSSAPTTVPAIPAAPCPTIVDAEAGLSFGCLVKSMQIFPGLTYLTQILAKTESSPDWYMSEYTARGPIGDVSLKSISASSLTAFAVGSYPPDSPVSVVRARATTVAGRPAYYTDARIKANKTGPGYAGLKANDDRVVIVVVARTDGTASELILAVPDTRKQLWPRMDVIVNTLQLV